MRYNKSYNIENRKREILCNKVTLHNSKKILLVFILKKVTHIKASLQSMVCPNPAFASGAANLVKNAKKAISYPNIQNESNLMRDNLRLRKELEEGKNEKYIN